MQKPRLQDEQNPRGVLGSSQGLRTGNDPEGSARASAKRSHNDRLNYGHILHETSSRVWVSYLAQSDPGRGPRIVS